MSTSASQLPVKEKRVKEPEGLKDKKTPAQRGGGKGKEQKKIKRTFSPPSLYWRLAVAGVLGLVLVGGIFFSAGQLKHLVVEVEKKRGQMVALQQKEENLKLLSFSLDSLKEEALLIRTALPDEKAVVDFIKKIEDFGRGISVGNFIFESDQPQLDQEGNSFIEWTIEVTGPVVELERFLTDLLNLPILIRPRLIDIDDMDKEISKLIFTARLYVEADFFGTKSE